MTYLAYALLALLLVAPAVAADEAPTELESESCTVLAVWHDPPDYRLDLDCLELPPLPPTP